MVAALKSIWIILTSLSFWCWHLLIVFFPSVCEFPGSWWWFCLFACFQWHIDFWVFCYGTLGFETFCFGWLPLVQLWHGKEVVLLVTVLCGVHGSSMFRLHDSLRSVNSSLLLVRHEHSSSCRYLLDGRGRSALLLFSMFPSWGGWPPNCCAEILTRL